MYSVMEVVYDATHQRGGIMDIDTDIDDILRQENEELLREEALFQAENLVEWNEGMDHLVECHGARDRAEAIRWDMAAMECEGEFVKYCRNWGLNPAMAGEIRSSLLRRAH